MPLINSFFNLSSSLELYSQIFFKLEKLFNNFGTKVLHFIEFLTNYDEGTSIIKIIYSFFSFPIDPYVILAFGAFEMLKKEEYFKLQLLQRARLGSLNYN